MTRHGHATRITVSPVIPAITVEVTEDEIRRVTQAILAKGFVIFNAHHVISSGVDLPVPSESFIVEEIVS